MESIIKIFLRAKHWQLFTIGFVPGLIFYIYTMSNVFGSDFINNPESVSSFMESYKYFGLIMILLAVVNYGWIWAVGVGLQAKVPPYVKMKVRRFKWFIGIPFFYLLFISLSITYGFMFAVPKVLADTFYPSEYIFLVMAAIIVPLHIFSLFAIFYSMYFAAKTLKTVEFQREVNFSDFVAEFFLIWFLPVGIWILQPKINRMEEGSDVFHPKTL